MTLRLVTPLRILALCTPLLATQVFASAMNEYTLSPSEMGTTVTSFQGTYQPQPVEQSYEAQPFQPSYQAQPMATETPQFGEIVYDTEPYMPEGTATDSYTMHPYSNDMPLQPVPMPQPTYQAPAYN